MNIVDKILKDSISYYEEEKASLVRKLTSQEAYVLELKRDILKVNQDLEEIQKEIDARQNQIPF